MKAVIISLCLLFPIVGFSQKSSINFKETVHDFGNIPENGGSVEHDFTFTNTGSVPLIITNVRTSCGCTTPSWSREPIAPNATGSIKVGYNPQNRPFGFNKTITVSSNAQNSTIVLSIKGNVTKEPADPYANYKYSLGAVKLVSNMVNLGVIKNTAIIERNLEFVNTGNASETIQIKTASPAITLSSTSLTLNKGEKGIIAVKYDAGKKKEWDIVTDIIKVSTPSVATSDITFTAIIQEDFSGQIAENFANSPMAVFSETEANLGTINKNSVATHEFYIENSGKSNLIIRKIKTSDQSLSVEMKGTTIKPGKKSKVTVSFQANDKAGKRIKIASFITNDPKNTTISYKLNGEIL